MPLLFERNDITRMHCDAIVNAANSSLLGGGGVDGAIHAAAGPELLAECRTLGGCRTGEAKITGAYRLPARYVIHTVGPIWAGGNAGEEEKLASCYRNSLRLAKEHDCASVAFPLISAGVYGVPQEIAVRTAVRTIREFLSESDDMTVTLVLFGKKSLAAAGPYAGEIRSFIDDHYAAIREERDRYLHRRPQERPYAGIRPDLASDQISMPLSLNEAVVQEAAFSQPVCAPQAASSNAPRKKRSLEELVEDLDESFREMLFRLIDEKGMTDPECYRKANLSRQHFSKIRSQKTYQPTRETVYALALALRLSLPETREFLSKGGFSMSRSNLTDVILEYYIESGIYDIDEVNWSLYRYDRPLLGAR